MLSLRVKAKIYQYTLLYLAKREEVAYMASAEAQNSIEEILTYKHNDLRRETVEDVVLGMWQAQHGFCRPMSFLQFKRPALLWKPIAFVQEFLTVLFRDIFTLFRR